MEDQEKVIKSLETSDFGHGGLLDPKRQKKFLKYVREYGKMLPMVRFESLNQSQMTLDKLYIGEPISHAVGENDSTAFLAKPQTGQIHILTKKLKSSWNVTTETLVNNLEQKGFEQTLMEGMSRRISTDIELLAIQGDEEEYENAVDVFGRLLKRQDGWDKLTRNAHILDVGGANVQKGIFAEMIRMMPQQYLNDPGLRWFVSKSVAIDWLDQLADRMTNLGDNALNGNSVSPYGIPLVEIPLLPDSKPLSTTKATPAQVVGHRADPFTINAGENDKLKINGITITIPAGTHRVGFISNLINGTADLTVKASDDTHGRLVLTDLTINAPATVPQIIIGAVDDDAYEELGFAEGTTDGSLVDVAGTINEGSFIWLANPQNFIAAMRGSTRVYTEFNKDYDRVETVLYNEVDFAIENDDAIVKAVNLRKRQLV